MASKLTGAVGGFGPFDSERKLKPTEYGGGAGLVEGSPKSQTGAGGLEGGADHLAGEGMTVDEKIGVAYRTDASGTDESGGVIDPVTGLSALDVD
jgi:hypothetical protein